VAKVGRSKLFEDSSDKPPATALKQAFTEEAPPQEGVKARFGILLGVVLALSVLAFCFAFEPAMLAVADCSIGMNNLEIAANIYDVLYNLHPNNFDILRAKARLECLQGGYEAAIKDDNAAIALRTDSADVYANRGFARYKIHDDLGAVNDFSRVLEREPTLADVYVRRGVVFARLGQFRNALNDYEKAMLLDPTNAEAASFKSWALDLQSNASMEKLSNKITPADAPNKLSLIKHAPLSHEIDEVPKLDIHPNSSRPLPIASVASVQNLPKMLPPAPSAPGKPINQSAVQDRSRQTAVTDTSQDRTQSGANIQSSSHNLSTTPATWSPVSTSRSVSRIQAQGSSNHGIQSFGYGLKIPEGGRITNGPATVSLLSDGDLVLYRNSQLVWSAHTHKPSMALNCWAEFQSDGNLVLFGSNNDGSFQYWSTETQHSATAPHAANTIELADTEPYLRIVDGKDNWAVWAAPPVTPATSNSGKPSSSPQESQPDRSTRRASPNQHGYAVLLSPASAPSLVLMASSPDPRDNMRTYTAAPTNVLEQKWVLESTSKGIYKIHPAFDRSLALTVVNGKFTEGTKIIVAVDHGYSTQHWAVSPISKGCYVLRPLCATALTLDNPAGPGAQPDLLHYSSGNLNTIWLLKQVSY
jgi:tetratricopeptide (TPR) repeat protein